MTRRYEEKYDIPLGELFRGGIYRNEFGQAGVVTDILLGDASRKTRVVGLYLDGSFDCEYKMTQLQRVKTRTGWRGRELRMIGMMSGPDLETAIALADSGEEFGRR